MACFALHVVDVRQHLLDCGNACCNRFFGAARLLDGHGAKSLVLDHAIGFLEARNLKPFAAQADHQHAAHVGVGGIAPGRPLQDVENHAAVVDHAAIVHLQSHDAVDVWIVIEHAGALHFLGNEARHRRGAIHRGQHADIVAGSDLAIGAADALEGGLLAERKNVLGLRILREGVVAVEVLHAGVVFMHPRAPGNVLRRKADDLPELAHRLSGEDRH